MLKWSRGGPTEIAARTFSNSSGRYQPIPGLANASRSSRHASRATGGPPELYDGLSDGSASSVDSLDPGETTQLDEDVYGATISSMLRDLRKLLIGRGNFCLRLSRLIAHALVLIALIFAQVFLVIKVKTEITPGAVADMRELYKTYEATMYNSTGDFDPVRFHSLPVDVKARLCSIPMSHPYFTFLILMIWTFTVIVDIRRSVFLVMLLTWWTPTVETVHDVFPSGGEDDDPLKDGDGKLVVAGLTLPIKVSLGICAFAPRVAIDLFLLWLGCRWLVATDNLQDAFLNCVALDFVLYLKDLVYFATVPSRTKRETLELVIPVSKAEPASARTFLGGFLWFLVGLSWALLYLFEFQTVLHDYRWDVRETCKLHGRH